MTAHVPIRGGAPVGTLTDVSAIEAAAIVYLRLWGSDTPERDAVRADFAATLGEKPGTRGAEAFARLVALCVTAGRRPLMRHGVHCRCIGADEAWFAALVNAGSRADHEETLMIAMAFLRPDAATFAVAAAIDTGLALRRMRLARPQEYAAAPARPTVLH